MCGVHSFHYRDRRLHCEEADLALVAAKVGTPAYVYSAGTIQDHYRRLDAALGGLDHQICYAVKANSNRAVLRLLAEEGAGFDIVSGGELFRVLAAGGEPGQCTFAGVGKSREEIEYALEQGVHCFNLESEAELAYTERIAAGKGARAPIALRVNPDVESGSHHYITTGRSENKFGIALDRVGAVYEAAARLPHITIRGVQMHIGSQITEAAPFAEAIAKITPLVLELKKTLRDRVLQHRRRDGDRLRVVARERERRLVETGPSPDALLTIEDYAAAIVPALRGLGLRILLEPGRFLVGNAGVLLTRVRYIKQTGQKKFVDRRCRDERSDSSRALPELSRDRAGAGVGECGARADRCGRSSLRERRFLCAGPEPCRRSPRAILLRS